MRVTNNEWQRLCETLSMSPDLNTIEDVINKIRLLQESKAELVHKIHVYLANEKR